jgi:hypothetical protein
MPPLVVAADSYFLARQRERSISWNGHLGGKAKTETILEMGLVPDGRWFVRAEAVERWREVHWEGAAATPLKQSRACHI